MKIKIIIKTEYKTIAENLKNHDEKNVNIQYNQSDKSKILI